MTHCDPKTITFADDKLGRDKYADFLIELVRNAKSEEGSYTIAVNAPYGSGKTTLLQMMRSRIKEKFSTTNIENPLTVVYYNAWRYDFFNEPLVPLASSLFEPDTMKDQKSYNKMIEKAKFVAFLSNGALNHFTGMDIHDAYQKSKSASDSEEKFSQYAKVIDDLCCALSEAVKEYGNNAKMLVIIDELDRCRPDFAIQTLESTKHLLVNKNIVFLYALDMGQLQKAVENAYGEGMDSAGYLLRFFDYITTIPEPDIGKYIKAIIENIEEEQYIDGVTKEMELCYGYFHMTLRDVDRVLSTYKQMLKYFLSKYEDIIAHQLYLHLLCMKYKRRAWFEDFIEPEKELNSGLREYYENLSRTNERNVNFRVFKLFAKKGYQISRDNQNYLCINSLHCEIFSKEIDLRTVKIERKEEDVVFRYITDRGYLTEYDFGKEYILGYVIFPQDIRLLASSGARSISEYIHRRMEFFDFETGLNAKEEA